MSGCQFIAALLMTLAASELKAADVVRACATNLEYPPYLFTKPAGPQLQGEHGGLAYDVLQYALRRHGRAPAQVSRLPWPRCIKLVEIGDLDLIMNVPTAQIDPSPFYISAPYATVHSVYYTSRKHWPNGLAIANVQDLRKYRVCGLIGNRFDGYGMPGQGVDTGASSYLSMINKLLAGHCDLFIEKMEVIDGLILRNSELARALRSPSLVRTPLPEDSPFGLHFAISRRKPGGQLLLAQLNSAISNLKKKQQLNRWLKEYTGSRAPPARKRKASKD